MPLVLVTGLPGSGKSTLAAALASRFGLPLIAKDRFKEILFDSLGVADMAWSQQLGRAAVALQFDAMRTVKHAVVDSALWTDRSEPELEALGLPMVQVYCECAFELARRRFFDRLQGGERHPGFCEEEMTAEDFERFRPLMEPLRLSFPLVRVDTSTPVDTDEVEVRLTSADPSLARTREPWRADWRDERDRRMSGSEASPTFFPYRFDVRFAPLWAPLAAWPGRDGVTLTEEGFRATFGLLKLETGRDNVIGGHVTERYRWYKAIGPRLSRVDDGLTFGTNADRGVCVHFREPVPRVIGFKSHSALTVTVSDCAGLVRAIGETTPRSSAGNDGSVG